MYDTYMRSCSERKVGRIFWCKTTVVHEMQPQQSEIL